MLNLVFKAIIGALLVVFIGLISKTKNYYLAGLAPLFPTFAIIAHYIIGSEHTTVELKTTIVFGMWALLPYFLYLLSMYLLADKVKISAALLFSSVVWCLASLILIYVWNLFQH